MPKATARKMKFFTRNPSVNMKKFFIENFIYCAVSKIMKTLMLPS